LSLLAKVHVPLKPGVNDPQGQAIRGGLQTLGFEGADEVRSGRYFELRAAANDRASAEAAVKDMCEKQTSPDEVLDYDATLTLHDPTGMRATFARTEWIRFLQDDDSQRVQRVVQIGDCAYDAVNRFEAARLGEQRSGRWRASPSTVSARWASCRARGRRLATTS
jgi:phosphoribosylformylglycinamidine synthase